MTTYMRKKSKSGMHEEPRRTIQIELKEEEGRDWNLHRVTRAGIRKHRGGHGGGRGGPSKHVTALLGGPATASNNAGGACTCVRREYTAP